MIRVFLIILLSSLCLYLWGEKIELETNLKHYKDLSCPVHDGYRHSSSYLNLGTKEFSCYYIENPSKIPKRR